MAAYQVRMTGQPVLVQHVPVRNEWVVHKPEPKEESHEVVISKSKRFWRDEFLK